jgi:hypothetical protein
MTLTVLRNNGDVEVEVHGLKNFQSIVDAALTLQLRPFARVRDHSPRTTINGRDYNGVVTLVDATNRVRTSLFNDQDIALIAVDAPGETVGETTVSYYFCVVRTAFDNWHLPADANVVKREGTDPAEFARQKRWVRNWHLDI